MRSSSEPKPTRRGIGRFGLEFLVIFVGVTTAFVVDDLRDLSVVAGRLMTEVEALRAAG